VGVLGKRAAAQGLDANALANTLLSEKPGIVAAAPSGLAQILGGGPAVVSRTPEAVTQTSRSVADVRKGPVIHSYPEHSYPEPHGQRRWIALVLIAFGVLALFSFIRPRTPRGVESDLGRFLGDSSRAAPRMFELDDVHFHAGTAQLTAKSEQAVNHLASVLKANPNAQIQLVGHANNAGSANAGPAQANRALVLGRVNAIKVMLGNQGVPLERISTMGVSQDRAVVLNDADLRLESHGADGELASSLYATLYHANAQHVGQDKPAASAASNDTEDLRLESHGADGELASSLYATLYRAQNPRIELIVVSK
jgi:outer membrane protein OmpA-like peptidoglycan-associated protein